MSNDTSQSSGDPEEQGSAGADPDDVAGTMPPSDGKDESATVEPGDLPESGDLPGASDAPEAGDVPAVGDKPGASGVPEAGDVSGTSDVPKAGDVPERGESPVSDESPSAGIPAASDEPATEQPGPATEQPGPAAASASDGAREASEPEVPEEQAEQGSGEAYASDQPADQAIPPVTEPLILPPEPSGPPADAVHDAGAPDDAGARVDAVESAAATAPYDATDDDATDAVPLGAAGIATAAGTAATESAEAPSAAATPFDEALAAPVPTPVYVVAPTPPRAKGNRLMGILIDVVATVAFAVVFAAVSLALYAITEPHRAIGLWERYLQTPGFWVPVIVFFLAYALLIAIVNRGRWAAYLVGSFFVGVVVYFAYLGGALLTVQAWHLSPSNATAFLGTLWTNPLTLASAIVAREASLWFGGWIAARGRRVREANLEAQREYDRRLAAGPIGGQAAAS